MSIYTVAEYAKKFNVTERRVRYKIEKEELKTSKSMINNRIQTVIVVDDDTPIKELSEHNNKLEHENVPIVNNTFQKSERQRIQSDSTELINFFREMSERLETLASEAGQVKLLTDSERSTQARFFELQQEFNQVNTDSKIKDVQLKELNNRIQEKEKIIEELKLKIQDLENKKESEQKSTWFKKL